MLFSSQCWFLFTHCLFSGSLLLIINLSSYSWYIQNKTIRGTENEIFTCRSGGEKAYQTCPFKQSHFYFIHFLDRRQYTHTDMHVYIALFVLVFLLFIYIFFYYLDSICNEVIYSAQLVTMETLALCFLSQSHTIVWCQQRRDDKGLPKSLALQLLSNQAPLLIEHIQVYMAPQYCLLFFPF